jgi:hypothetical protein
MEFAVDGNDDGHVVGVRVADDCDVKGQCGVRDKVVG